MEHAQLAGARDPLEEALPYLDEALCDLPDSDRELIHLRYSEGLSFTQAAQRVGRSEAALRQQASRAMGKLQCQLSRRGVVVPVTFLAAGLGVTLSGTTSASAALAISTAAIASSPALGAGGLTWINILTMSTSKSILSAVVLAALLVAGPAIWLEHQIRETRAQAAAGITESRGRNAGQPDAASQAKPVNSPEEKKRTGAAMGSFEEKAAQAMMGEMKAGMADWLLGDAELRGRRFVSSLRLDPEKAHDLMEILNQQAREAVANMFENDNDPSSSAELREQQQKALDAWFAVNLTAEQSEDYQRMNERMLEARAEDGAAAALSAFSTDLTLSPGQKDALRKAALNRGREDLARFDGRRSVAMGMNFFAGASQPVEERSGFLMEKILEPSQQEIWSLMVQRDQFFHEQLPQRLLTRLIPLLKEPGAGDALKDAMDGR